MPGKFHYKNQSQRFDLYTFYALLTKCKIVELLDKNGHTPFDSDTINNNVLDYALQIYKDILDNGIITYFDSDSFRHDSDGSGNNGWNGVTRNASTARVYEPLRKFLYSQSNNNGVDETQDIITTGFSRKYYTIPLSDSEGTVNHINVYSFMKRHLNRWLSYDSFERYKLTKNILTVMQQDSDVSNFFANQFIKACEEDSDLSRRTVEMYSNRLQSDSEVRQEFLKTAITALSGLTPGGDSDSARALTEVVSSVYENDSEVRNEFGDQIVNSLLEDSDQQNELRDIISSTELVVLNAPLVTARQVLPMPAPPAAPFVAGQTVEYIGYSNPNNTQSFYVNVNDALGGAPPPPGSVTTPPYYGGSGVVIKDILLAGDLNSSNEFIEFKLIGDSDGAGNIQNNAYDLQDNLNTSFQNDDFNSITGGNTFGGNYFPNFNVTNYLIIDSAGDLGTPGDAYLKFDTYYTPQVGSFVFSSAEQAAGVIFKFKIVFDSDSIISSNPPQSSVSTGSIGDSNTKWSTANFTTLRSDNTKIDNAVRNRIVLINDSEGILYYTTVKAYWAKDSDNDSDFKFVIPRLQAKVDSKFASLRVKDLEAKGIVHVSNDSEQTEIDRLITNNNLIFNDNVTIFTYKFGDGGNSIVGDSEINGVDENGKILSYTPGQIQVFLNDVLLQDSDDYTATDGLSIHLFTAPDSDDVVKIFSYLGSAGIIYKNKKLIAIDSDKFYDLLIENRGLYTIDSDGVDSVIKDTPVKSEYSWFIGQRGDTYVINPESTDSDSNNLFTRKLVYTSDKVVDSQQELSRALGDVVTKSEVFNTWYRISHQYNGGGTPGTFNYPANSTEQNSWAFDAVNDIIYTTANTTTYCGFISSDTYDDFTFNSTLNAPYVTPSNPDTNDDDVISSIVAFVTEGQFGQPGYREHTLSFIRNHGGFPMLTQNYGSLGPVTWALVYNYNQDDVRLLVNGTSTAPVSTAPWNTSPYGTKVWIRRKGDNITAYCSQMNDSTYTLDSDTEIVWDLASDSDTIKFRGPVRYGYGAHSQNGSYWSDIFFAPDAGSYLHSVQDGALSSVGGVVYQYNPDTVAWEQDSDLTIDNTVGERILHNQITHKTFYNDPVSDTTFKIMTARKFSDVFTLPALVSEPDSDTLGRMGLRPGTFAMADGVSWDPGFIGGTTPYPVFYDGVAWYYFSLY